MSIASLTITVKVVARTPRVVIVDVADAMIGFFFDEIEGSA